MDRGGRWKGKFGAIVLDMDGTLTGLPQCHLHGCFTHAPVGYFPPSHCTRHSIGMVCTNNVRLPAPATARARLTAGEIAV